MKNLKMMTLSVLMLLIGTMSTFAQRTGQQKPRHQMEQGRENQERGPRIPNLTEDQKQQLKTAKVNLQRETLPLKNELREKKARLQTLKTTEGSSEKSINKVIDQIGDLQTKMMKARTANQMEVKKFLTEEQRLFLASHAGNKKRKGHKSH
jgi:Spy/CpxP family protein refolding chaperone